MTEQRKWIALVVLVVATLATRPMMAAPDAAGALVRIRPATLSEGIDVLAGQPVEMSGARVIGTFGTTGLVVESATPLRPTWRRPDRVVVLLEAGQFRVSRDVLAGATVRVIGVARTPLGLQLTGEVPWPAEARRFRGDRRAIGAAVLATSVQTADGVELTDRVSRPIP